MKKEQFEAWLSTIKGYQPGTIISRISNCERIEDFEGNLDELFEHDALAGLIERLSYSKQDEHQNAPPRHTVPINGNIYNGTATLRSAVKLYQEFAAFGNISDNTHPVELSPKKRGKAAGYWPTWDVPTSKTILDLTKMITPYIRFLHPNVVKQLVEDNERNRRQWKAKLERKGIDPDYYLWEKSSCVFPGIRRYAGSKEIAYFRNQLGQPSMEMRDALKIDDNSFPKHIWSFIFRGKEFQKSGPKGYALAHLADHKTYKSRIHEEFETTDAIVGKLYGLFTCASNAVYMSTCLLKLTDFNPEVRVLLLHKAQLLYGTVCNLLPPEFKLKTQNSPAWHIDNFEWSEPVGADAVLEEFLQFRYETIDRL